MKAVYQIVFCAGTKTISDGASVAHKNGDFRRDFCNGAKLRRVNFESGKSHTGYWGVHTRFSCRHEKLSGIIWLWPKNIGPYHTNKLIQPVFKIHSASAMAERGKTEHTTNASHWQSNVNSMRTLYAEPFSRCFFEMTRVRSTILLKFVWLYTGVHN